MMWNNAMAEGGNRICQLCGDVITQLGVYTFYGWNLLNGMIAKLLAGV